MTLTTAKAPADFDRYWAAMNDELVQLPIAPELTEIPIRTTDFGVVYALHLTSLGAYRIFAYYCVPHGDGPFPVLYHTPGYGSVVHVPAYEERQRYVVVALCHRGQRLSDQPFAAAYPGLLTHGISAPTSYIYRGIVADHCRVVDFLLTRPEVDKDRIAVIGGDLALITAALRPQVDALYTTPAIFYAAETLAPRTSAYPLEEINDYLRTYPEQAAAVWQTLAYFDPIHFAPRVQCDAVLVSGNEKDALSPEVIAPLAAALGGPVTQIVSAHSAYQDGVKMEAWLRARYGYEEALLPRHWR